MSNKSESFEECLEYLEMCGKDVSPIIKKIDELEKEIKDYQEGWLGCCHTCEPVAIKNKWQNEVIHRLSERLDFVLGRLDTLLGGEAGMNHIRKFNNDIKKGLENEL